MTSSVLIQQADGVHPLPSAMSSTGPDAFPGDQLDLFRKVSTQLGCDVSGPQFPHLKTGTSLTWLWQGYNNLQCKVLNI